MQVYPLGAVVLVALLNIAFAHVLDTVPVLISVGSARIKANLLQCPCSPTPRGFADHVKMQLMAGDRVAEATFKNMIAAGLNTEVARDRAQEIRQQRMETCIDLYGAEACVNADAAMRKTTVNQYCAYDKSTGRNVRESGSSNLLTTVGQCDLQPSYSSSPFDRGVRRGSIHGRPIGGAAGIGAQVIDFPDPRPGTQSTPGVGGTPAPSPTPSSRPLHKASPPSRRGSGVPPNGILHENPNTAGSGHSPDGANPGANSEGGNPGGSGLTPSPPAPGGDHSSQGVTSENETPFASSDASPSPIVPAVSESVNEGCVAVEHLTGYVLQHKQHLMRNVLCGRGFCATANHAIIVGGKTTSMKQLCSTGGWKCIRQRKLVNNLKIARNTRAVVGNIIVTPYDVRFPVAAIWALQMLEDVLNLTVTAFSVSALASICLFFLSRSASEKWKIL